MKEIITFTSSNLPYGWMGNMAGFYKGKPLTIEYEGKIWKTTENLFQALRFDDLGIQGLIRKENGYNGKKVAKRFTADMCIKPLGRQDILNMVLCVRLKIEQHPELYKELIDTGEKIIIEDVTKRIGGTGMFWGSAKLNQHWIGHNVLGHVYMYLRDDIQAMTGLYDDEDDMLDYIFNIINHSESIGKVTCKKSLIEQFDVYFEEGLTYNLLDETNDAYYVENSKGETIKMYKEDYGSLMGDDIFGNIFNKIK